MKWVRSRKQLAGSIHHSLINRKMSKSSEKVKKKYADAYKWCDDEVELLLTVTKEYLSLIHISEPTRRVVISYAVFCLKKKSHSSATGASSMTRTVQLLRHDAYNCPITSAWRVQLSNYGWNQGCWGPIRFENFDIVVISLVIAVEIGKLYKSELTNINSASPKA